MINFCKSKGLNAELKDAIKALEEIKDKSLDGIFISQVVEHLNPRYLVNMLNLCNKKMKYGFYIIIETVNPLSLFSFANFYIDLSHVKPVHPETLKFLVSNAGFRDIETKFSSPVPPEMKLKKLPNLEDTDQDKSMIEISNQNIDMEVPVPYAYLPPGYVEGTDTPGAETSGLMYVLPSRVTGPRPLKSAITSEESVAPTVSELSSSPGHVIVPDPSSPSLPAAITGTTPAATTLFIAVVNNESWEIHR